MTVDRWRCLVHVTFIRQIVTTYCVFALLSISQGHDSLIPPAVVTSVLAGSQAVLTCTLPSNAPNGATVTWSLAIPQADGRLVVKKIITAPGSFLYNPSNKYSINDTYNLVISNADEQTDGTTYTCDPSTDPDIYSGDLIVIDKLNASVSQSGSFTVGSNVTFTCTLYYGAQPNLHNQYFPTLSLFLGGNEILGQTTHTQPSGSSLYHTATLVASHVVIESDKGQSWSCRASSQPSFTMSSEPQQLLIDYPPSYIIISPVKSSYEVGELINCTADGYPIPTVQWIQGDTSNVEAPGPGSAVLTIKQFAGAQHWTCEARNRVGTLNKTHSFTSTITNAPTHHSVSPVLVVVLSVVIPVVVVLIIVITVVLCINRRKSPVKGPLSLRQPSTGPILKSADGQQLYHSTPHQNIHFANNAFHHQPDHYRYCSVYYVNAYN